MSRTFDIPAIHNEFEVLAKCLGIADSDDQGRTQIHLLGEKSGVHEFKHGADLYSVARKSLLPDVKNVHEFNSGWYAIRKS